MQADRKNIIKGKGNQQYRAIIATSYLRSQLVNIYTAAVRQVPALFTKHNTKLLAPCSANLSCVGQIVMKSCS
jgi:hypothetical protein